MGRSFNMRKRPPEDFDDDLLLLFLAVVVVVWWSRESRVGLSMCTDGILLLELRAVLSK